jgi:hypothetical protein
VTKDRSESFVQTIVRDDGVRRACADVVMAFVAALTKGVAPTPPKD